MHSGRQFIFELLHGSTHLFGLIEGSCNKFYHLGQKRESWGAVFQSVRDDLFAMAPAAGSTRLGYIYAYAPNSGSMDQYSADIDFIPRPATGYV